MFTFKHFNVIGVNQLLFHHSVWKANIVMAIGNWKEYIRISL